MIRILARSGGMQRHGSSEACNNSILGNPCDEKEILYELQITILFSRRKTFKEIYWSVACKYHFSFEY